MEGEKISLDAEERPTMKQLQNVIRTKDIDITTKWWNLGLELLDSDSYLREIEADHRNDVNACCRAMLEKWLEVKWDANWNHLVTALKNIEMNTSANAISKLFKSGSQVANRLLPTKIIVPDKASFEFAKLVQNIISELEKNKEHNLDCIINFCGHLSPEDDPAALLFNDDQLKTIKRCNNLKALFDELRYFWRWDNLSLLEGIIQLVGTELCKLFLREYQQSLDYKMELRKIYAHFEKEKCLPPGYSSVFAEPGRAYGELALDEYSELMQFTSQCCGVKQMFMLPFARPLSDSSVLFEWFIPLKVIRHMIEKATDNIRAFTQKGFVFLKIDSTEIFDLRIKTVDENKSLSDAIKCGNVTKVKSLLQFVDPERIDKWTALHAAAENGQVAVVETLIELGANVNTISMGDWTPLLGAARNNHVAVIETLVRSGADINGGNLDKWTPVFCAAKCGHTEAVESLIKLGANIWAGNIKEWTPLHTAARNGHITVVEILLEGGANIDAGDRKNWTPLHAAARQGHARVVKILIKGGANINVGDVKRWTPLHAAAKQGHVNVVETMIELGADLASFNFDKWTPLHGAAEQGHVRVAELLVKSGANVNAATNDGWSSLHFAAECDHVEMVNYLIKSKANIQAATKDKFSPLHFAALNGHTQVAEILLNSRADTNAVTSHGSTPLHLAVQNVHSSVVKLLIGSGANANAIDKDESSSLHFAAKSNSIKIMELLINSGTNVNVRDKNLYSPLHFAVKNGYIEMVKMLVRAGADINAVNKYKRTPLHMAVYKDKLLAKSLKADTSPSTENRHHCWSENVLIYFLDELKMDTTKLDEPSQAWVKEVLEEWHAYKRSIASSTSQCNFM